MDENSVKDRLDPAKQKRTLVLLFVLLAAFLVLYDRANAPGGAEEEVAGRKLSVLTGSFGSGQPVYLEVADTEAKRIKGLSGRESLGENEGLLFVFDESGFPGIWMKEMNFAIDILWLDKDFKVVSLKERVFPESYPEIFRPDSPARYVLEILAGGAGRLGGQIGGELKLSGRI